MFSRDAIRAVMFPRSAPAQALGRWGAAAEVTAACRTALRLAPRVLLLTGALLLASVAHADDTPAAIISGTSTQHPAEAKHSQGQRAAATESGDGGAHTGEVAPPASAAAAETHDSSAPTAAADAIPCSDHQPDFPTCGISAAEARKANSLYREAEKLLRQDRYDAALLKLAQARAISPRDVLFATAEQTVRSQYAANQLRLGDQAVQLGDAKAALAAFRRALEIDPGNDYAAQRLHDALPPAEQIPPQINAIAVDETKLTPQPGTRNFTFRGPSSSAIQTFAALFGIATTIDEGLTPRNVRVKLDDVDWVTGSQILQRVCKVLILPLGAKQVLVANDTDQNRRELLRMSVQTFYAQGAPQQITELSTALRALFELRFLATNPSQGSLTIRAPGATLRAVARLLEDLQDERPGVMLDIRIFQLSTSFTRDLGISVPNEFTIFNVPTELRNLVGGASFQQILAALQASGQSVNASTILAALLATGSATPLAQPFATFGGGITLTGVTIPSTTLHFSDTNSVARTVTQSLLRSQHGSAATLKVGQRYPIITTFYSASTAQSSLLSSLGVSTPGLRSSVSVPSPQFSYEDLGLVLKATPQVHGTLISVEYELALRGIGTTQANGPPVITNRESKGTISTEDGQPVVIAGLVDRSEIASMSGIPALAAVPVLGRATSVRNKQKLADELLIVITPRITLQRGERGIYVPLPTNVPK